MGLGAWRIYLYIEPLASLSLNYRLFYGFGLMSFLYPDHKCHVQGLLILYAQRFEAL